MHDLELGCIRFFSFVKKCIPLQKMKKSTKIDRPNLSKCVAAIRTFLKKERDRTYAIIKFGDSNNCLKKTIEFLYRKLLCNKYFRSIWCNCTRK